MEFLQTFSLDMFKKAFDIKELNNFERFDKKDGSGSTFVTHINTDDGVLPLFLGKSLKNGNEVVTPTKPLFVGLNDANQFVLYQKTAGEAVSVSF